MTQIEWISRISYGSERNQKMVTSITFEKFKPRMHGLQYLSVHPWLMF